MSCLVPFIGANHDTIKINQDPDEAYDTDNTVADEQDIVGSLSFVAFIKAWVSDTIHCNWDKKVRRPKYKLVDPETYSIPAWRILWIEGDVEVADSRDGLTDREAEKGVEFCVKIAAAVRKVEVEADKEEGWSGRGHVSWEHRQVSKDKILICRPRNEVLDFVILVHISTADKERANIRNKIRLNANDVDLLSWLSIAP